MSGVRTPFEFFGSNSLGSPSAAEQGEADDKSQQENRARNRNGNCAGVSQTLNIENFWIKCHSFQSENQRKTFLAGFVSVVSGASVPASPKVVSGASVVFTVSTDTSVDGPGFENMQGIPIVNFAQIILWWNCKSRDWLQWCWLYCHMWQYSDGQKT